MDSRPNALLGTASAQVPLERCVDLLVGRSWRLPQQRHCRDDLTSLAVAALRNASIQPSLLHGVQLLPVGKALYSRDGAFLHVLDRHDAGALRRAVKQDGAGTTQADPAAVFGANKAQMLAQNHEE